MQIKGKMTIKLKGIILENGLIDYKYTQENTDYLAYFNKMPLWKL